MSSWVVHGVLVTPPAGVNHCSFRRARWLETGEACLVKLTVAPSPQKPLVLSLPFRTSVYRRFTGKSTSRTSKKVNERGENKSVRSILLWQQRHLLRTHDHSPFPTVPAKTQLPLLQYNCDDFVCFNTIRIYCVK